MITEQLPINPQWEAAETISEADLLKMAGNAATMPENEPKTNEPTQQTQAQQQQVNSQQFTPPPQDLNIGSFIDEKVAVEFIDIGVPTLIGVLLRATMGVKVNKSQLQATNGEKELLYAPTKAVLQQWNVKVTNPFEALAYSVLCVYGSKTALVMTDEALKPKPQQRAINSDDFTDLNNIPRKGRGRPRKNG